MKPSNKSTDMLNLSQSLEDNQTKIEETHKLIQQIEKQLQTLSNQPSIPLTIPTETYIQNQSQNQHDLFQIQQQIEQQNQEADYASKQYFLNQQDNQITEYGQSKQNQFINQAGQISLDQQGSIQLESKQQSAQFQQLSHNNSLPVNQQAQNREIGKIRSQINPPSREERSGIINTGVNYSLLKDGGKDREGQDIKEIQREHFQEITLLEQAYRKKILEMEEIIEQQKLQYEKQVIDMQHMFQVIEQKESIIGSYKDRYTDQNNQQRSQQDHYSELIIYAKRLESSEKEKQELMNQNQDLVRQYKLVLSQNEILSNKYNRILSLYNQLVDTDREKLIQMQYAEAVNKEQSLFLSPTVQIQQPHLLNQNQINISSIQANPLVNSTPGPNHLQDSHIQQQNELDLLDEIYQQRNAAVFNSFNRKPQAINFSNQKNTYGQQLKKQLFPVEQMYNNLNNQNYNNFNQNYQTANAYQTNQAQFMSNHNQNQTQEVQQMKIQNKSQRNQSNHSSDSDNNPLPSKDINNFNNQQTLKQHQSPLSENKSLIKNKSPSSKTRKIGSDLQKNVTNIKNALDENIKINDQYNSQSQIKQNTQYSKTETLQNILDISGSVSNKKPSKSKQAIGSKSVLANKSNQSGLGIKSTSQSKTNLKAKSTKKTQK